MGSRSSLLAAIAATVAILFAQVSIAAAAWESVPSHCQDSAPSSNVCASHCANNDLTLDTPRINIPEPVATPAPVTQIFAFPYPEVVPPHFGVLPAGPPPSILFKTFRS